jgi:hypothetical protein
LRFDNPVVLLRSAKTGLGNKFEFAIKTMCVPLGVPTKAYVPEDGGREQVFYRDIEMTKEADVVIAVFHEDSPMEGGTAHVVEKAQDRHVPVYAYTWSPSRPGEWARLGEWDPDDSWAHRMPKG